MRSPARRPRVVIAGMGDTGLLVATRLARRFDVVGIGTAPVFVSGQELGTRLARPQQWRRDYLVEYGRYRRLRGVERIHGQVVRVDPQARVVSVRQADGVARDIAYDAFVIATGTTNGFWRTGEVRSRSQIDAAVRDAAETIAAASSVAVVGGGPTGVSVASNVADAHPHIEVALYHSGDVPLAGYHRRTRARVVRRLQRQGVRRMGAHRAVLPDDVTSLGPATIEWSTGQDPVSADVVVWAVGRVRPNTTFLPEDFLDEEGFVRVDATLRVPGATNVFAIGDVAATDPLRCSARNFGHRLAAHNVSVALTGRGRLRRFRPPRHRWGSILGVQADGMRIFTPRGGVVRLTPGFARRVLLPVFTHRLIYGGLRRRP